jgi:hypothetical protein
MASERESDSLAAATSSSSSSRWSLLFATVAAAEAAVWFAARRASVSCSTLRRRAHVTAAAKASEHLAAAQAEADRSRDFATACATENAVLKGDARRFDAKVLQLEAQLETGQKNRQQMTTHLEATLEAMRRRAREARSPTPRRTAPARALAFSPAASEYAHI